MITFLAVIKVYTFKSDHTIAPSVDQADYPSLWWIDGREGRKEYDGDIAWREGKSKITLYSNKKKWNTGKTEHPKTMNEKGGVFRGS